MRRLPCSEAEDAQPETSAGERRLARVLTRPVLTALVLLFLWLTIKVDLVLFGGILLAICLSNTADCLSAWSGLARGWALAIVVLLIATGIAGMLLLFASTIEGQVAELSRWLPQDLAQVAHSLSQIPIARNLMTRINPEDLVRSLSARLSDVVGIFWTTAEVIAGLVVIAFVGIYVAAEARLYRAGLLRLVPPGRRARAGEILDETGYALWEWTLGRLISMTTLGILTGIGLSLLGVPAAFALALLAGLMIFVPYIGAILSAVPSVVVALSISPRLALWVVVLYFAIHLLEGYLLAPLVQRRAAHLPPALTLAVQLIMGVLAGLLGLLFATPLLAGALVLVRTLYIEDTLGDTD